MSTTPLPTSKPGWRCSVAECGFAMKTSFYTAISSQTICSLPLTARSNWPILDLLTPFMAGNSDLHQLELICQAIGSPTEENWPGVSSLDAYVPVQKEGITAVRSKADFLSMFPTIGASGVDMLMSMLSLNPAK